MGPQKSLSLNKKSRPNQRPRTGNRRLLQLGTLKGMAPGLVQEVRVAELKQHRVQVPVCRLQTSRQHPFIARMRLLQQPGRILQDCQISLEVCLDYKSTLPFPAFQRLRGGQIVLLLRGPMLLRRVVAQCNKTTSGSWKTALGGMEKRREREKRS